jgi:hypothetical protein
MVKELMGCENGMLVGWLIIFFTMFLRGPPIFIIDPPIYIYKYSFMEPPCIYIGPGAWQLAGDPAAAPTGPATIPQLAIETKNIYTVYTVCRYI